MVIVYIIGTFILIFGVFATMIAYGKWYRRWRRIMIERKKCPDCNGELRFTILDYDENGRKIGGYYCYKCHQEYEAEEIDDGN